MLDHLIREAGSSYGREESRDTSVVGSQSCQLPAELDPEWC